MPSFVRQVLFLTWRDMDLAAFARRVRVELSGLSEL